MNDLAPSDHRDTVVPALPLRYPLPALAWSGLLLFLAYGISRKSPPPISVDPAGIITGGSVAGYPYGRFTLTNRTTRRLHWVRQRVEVPADPDFRMWSSADSTFPLGVLNVAEQTHFLALIPHRAGVPFRVWVGYRTEPNWIDDVRAKLPAFLDTWWPRRDVFRTFTSDWYRITLDPTNAVEAGKPGVSP